MLSEIQVTILFIRSTGLLKVCYVMSCKWFWSICQRWVILRDLMFSWWRPWRLLFSGVLTREVWYLLTINLCGVVFFYRAAWHHIPQNSNLWWLILFTQDRTLYHLMSHSTNSRVISFKTNSVVHGCWTITCIMKIFSGFTHVT